MSFEDFLFVALAAILFSGMEPLWPSWNSNQQNFSSFRPCCYRPSFGSKRPKVWEEMSKIDFQDSGCGGHLGLSIGSFRCPNAHHQVSIQLDYRGNVQNMNSQHFSHINLYGRYKCMGKQIWPCHKKVKRQHRTIILAILVDILSPIICVQIRPQGLFGSGEEDF